MLIVNSRHGSEILSCSNLEDSEGSEKAGGKRVRKKRGWIERFTSFHLFSCKSVCWWCCHVNSSVSSTGRQGLYLMIPLCFYSSVTPESINFLIEFLTKKAFISFYLFHFILKVYHVTIMFTKLSPALSLPDYTPDNQHRCLSLVFLYFSSRPWWCIFGCAKTNFPASAIKCILISNWTQPGFVYSNSSIRVSEWGVIAAGSHTAMSNCSARSAGTQIALKYVTDMVDKSQGYLRAQHPCT